MAHGMHYSPEATLQGALVEWKESHSLVPYRHGVDWMKQRVNDIVLNGAPEIIWLLEHEAVYTYGPQTSSLHLQAAQQAGLTIESTDRGGQMTYHGPGQTVIYGMIHLTKRSWSIRHWTDIMMQWVRDALGSLGVPILAPHQQEVGLWTEQGKLASIGLRVSRGVTSYGLAFNHWPQTQSFQCIAPCGNTNTIMTSLQEHHVILPRTELWRVLKHTCPLRLLIR